MGTAFPGLDGPDYGQNSYDVDRFRRVLTLSAELAAMELCVSARQVRTAYRSHLARVTPLLAVEAMVIREGRVLLIRRTDTNRWALLGGIAEVGETPTQGAERELFEETGLRGVATRLLAILDSRYAPNLHGLLWPLFFWSRLQESLTPLWRPVGRLVFLG